MTVEEKCAELQGRVEATSRALGLRGVGAMTSCTVKDGVPEWRADLRLVCDDAEDCARAHTLLVTVTAPTWTSCASRFRRRLERWTASRPLGDA